MRVGRRELFPQLSLLGQTSSESCIRVDMQKQIENIENISNYVAETYMKLCPKHSNDTLDRAERKRVSRRKKEHKKSSGKRRIMVLRKHAQELKNGTLDNLKAFGFLKHKRYIDESIKEKIMETIVNLKSPTPSKKRKLLKSQTATVTKIIKLFQCSFDISDTGLNVQLLI